MAGQAKETAGTIRIVKTLHCIVSASIKLKKHFSIHNFIRLIVTKLLLAFFNLTTSDNDNKTISFKMSLPLV